MIFIRSLLFNLFVFGSLTLICIYGVTFGRRSPGMALRLGQLWSRLTLPAARILCGIEIKVTGREHLPEEGPALIASQHQSAFDTVIWFSLVPRPAYVVKRELARTPLFGVLAVQAGMIPVDRDGGGPALRALVRSAEQACADRRQIVIFPEGTRSPPGTVGELQPGVAAMAARTGLPVIPVRTDSGRCWGRRNFHKLPGVIHVEILPPLSPGLRRGALMEALGEAYRGQGK